MYKFQELNEGTSTRLVLKHTDERTQLVINLHEGARVSFLKHQGHVIINDLEQTSYATNFAAALLFPFANRIENGHYSFNNQEFQLECNEQVNPNAIHGLVYNKLFSILHVEEDQTHVSVTLNYKELEGVSGFPFLYAITVTYVLSDAGLSLKFEIRNEGEQSFPFTLGWHPYFISSDMSKSHLILNATKAYKSNDSGIITGDGEADSTRKLPLGGLTIDDVFAVALQMAEFITPDYRIEFLTKGNENFLQVFTPPETNAIAIEPMVGISNSFNNKIGLNILGPDQSFEKEWRLNIFKLKGGLKH